MRTLRNKSDPSTKAKMRKLVPKNDYVRNKDRQDPMAVLKLTEENLTSFLESLDYVGHTIIPELDKYTEHNQVGMYPNPISITTGPFGSLLFLTFNSATGKSNLYQAQLHSPITKVQAVAKDLSANEIHYQDGVIFFCGKGTPIGFNQLTKGTVMLEPDRLKTRQMVLDNLQQLGIDANGNVPTLRKHLAQHLEGVRKAYLDKGFSSDQLNFWNEQIPKRFESIHVIDLQLMYAACTTEKRIVSVNIQKDGIGLRGDYEALINYGSDWQEVSSLCINRNQLYIAHTSGVEVVALTSLHTVRIIRAGSATCLTPHTLAPHGDGVVLSDPDSHRVLKWLSSENNVEVFTGDGAAGNNDGLASSCRLSQPSGICSEFNKVVYLCDTQASCIKVFTTLKNTAEFLRELENCFLHSPSTKSTRSMTYATLKQLSAE